MSYVSWIDIARFFLREAERYFNEGVYWAACFNSYQSAESYLRGMLFKITNMYPFTHDLMAILNEIEKHGYKVPENIRYGADYLTLHYISAMYPGSDLILYDKRRATNCLKYSRMIAEFVEEILSKDTNQ